MQLQTSAVVDATRGLLKAFGYFAEHLWHVDDVHFICEQNNLPALEDHEAMQILALAHEQFDGETGVSWPQLEQSVHVFLKRRAALAQSPQPLNVC